VFAEPRGRGALASDTASRSWQALALAVVLLTGANVVTNRLLPAALYVPWNLLVAATLACIALLALRTPSELGWQRWVRGAVVGGAVLLATLALYVVALSLPSMRDMFHDSRVGGGVATLLYQAALRIPFGTVVLEELAFRSVVPALAARRLGVIRACMLSSVLFGLWHVLPAMSLDNSNSAVGGLLGTGTAGTVLAVVGGVVGTALAGLWLCWLRYWSGSLLAPMLAHLSTNSLGYVIAWFVLR
jgi:membrane protease YdiL (CAAX protease family)